MSDASNISHAVVDGAARSDAPIDRLKLAAARLRAAEQHPFLAVALYALEPVREVGLGTFGVDGRWRLHIDPDVLDRWTVEEVAGVLLHEVGHLVRQHGERAVDIGVDADTRTIWNIAADIEINDPLIKDGIVLPDQPCTARMFRLEPGRAAEHYYRALKPLKNLPAHLDCGEGAHGIGDRIGARADATLPIGVSRTEGELIRREIARTINQLAAVNPGAVSGSWLRWAEALLNPQLDWRQLLRSAVRHGVAVTSGATDFTYQRLSRRRVPNVVLPAMAKPIPSVALVVDTSGSIADEALSLAFTEVHGCLKHLGVRRDLLSVWATDMEAHKIDLRNSRRIQMLGGGGTDMGVGIAAALRQHPKPGLIVVLTDGHTPWPERKPDAHVVVAMLPSAWKPPTPPTWAKVVHVVSPT